MTVGEALRLSHIAPLDRELILGAVLKKDRAFLLAHPEHSLTPLQLKRFQALAQRREHHEPLAYILGEKEFFHLSFLVNRFTLIPRPETELLVEEALKVIHQKQKSSAKKKIAVIDVGTGSGCIIVSVVKNFLHSQSSSHSSFFFFGIDNSLRALNVAEKNAARHQVTRNITFLHSNLFEKLTKKELKKFDEIIVLANLPYLSEAIYQEALPTVRDFEPKTALVSGSDGLDHYRSLLGQLVQFVPEKKVDFLLEISPEQEVLLPKLLQSVGIKNSSLLQDLTGRVRLVLGTF